MTLAEPRTLRGELFEITLCHRMSLRSRTSARQAPGQLSTSNFNQRESQPSTSEPTREKTKPQPRAQSRCHVQRHSASYDSSDDEILVPMKSSALTKALVDDEQSEPRPEYAIPGGRPTSPSAQPPPRVCTRRSVLAASTSSISEDRGHLRESVWRNLTQRVATLHVAVCAGDKSGEQQEIHQKGVAFSDTG